MQDELLAVIRSCYSAILEASDPSIEDALLLAEKAALLDGWLSEGGAMPQAWQESHWQAVLTSTNHRAAMAMKERCIQAITDL